MNGRSVTSTGTRLPRTSANTRVPGAEQHVLIQRAANREASASESFLEFRLDYLSRPEQGLDVIRKVLERHPGCAILA